MFSNYQTGFVSCILASILLSIVISCGVTGEDEFRETYIFDVHNQSEIVSDTTNRQVGPDSTVTVYNFSIEPGSSLVFEYGRNVHPPDNVTDAGLTETLAFQVPADSESFKLKETQLQEAEVFYRRGCFCPESGAGFKVERGYIEGEKLSANIWFVRADVTISGFGQNFDVAFEHIFRFRP